MKYMGSKRRIAKYILPLINDRRALGQRYIEPFVGGGNLIDLVGGPCTGYDNNKYVVAALQHIRDSPEDLPINNSDFTENDYKDVKDNRDDLPLWFVGYVGYALSYGGKWWGGWRRGGGRDYVAESFRNAQKQSLRLKGVVLRCRSYLDVTPTHKSIIYCDPPYEGVTKYVGEKFDSPKFWEWCRKMSCDGHTVLVSEYKSPPDFKVIWSREIVSSLTEDTGGKKGEECCFEYAPN